MSRRSRRVGEATTQTGRPAQSGRPPGYPPNRRPPRISFFAQAGILLGVFAVTALIAELAGAANLGVALGIGSIFFAIALVVVIVKT